MRQRATPPSPRCPRVLVVPRPGFGIEGAEVLDIDADLAHVSSTRARAGEHHLVAPEARRRLIVDGNNVIGSRPDGWWRDRPGAARRLVEELAGTRGAHRRPRRGRARRPSARAACPRACTTACSSRTRARGGRDAADDRIVEEVARDPRPGVAHGRDVGPRAVRARARDLGAAVEGAQCARSGIGTPVTPSSRSTRNVLSAIDTRWYCPTVKTRSSICCSS